MQPKQIVTPKSFYVAERDRFYSDWTMSFWRELFQNSVDAGAKAIRVSISNEAGKGSFGRDPSLENVVRIVFDDDGCGMDRDVLDDVYFAPGETTKKDGEFTGGYGRARLMTCFSQVRYGIRTHDCVVEGDGPEYTNQDIDDALAVATGRRNALTATIAEAEAKGEIVDPAAVGRLADLDAEIGFLDTESGYREGCRIEVDINPSEDSDRPWKNADLERMLARLREYLGQSQVPCKVFINGEEHTEKCKRGPAKRQIVATTDDGSEVAFATVHLSQSPNARHKGKVIVRVDGAAMFVKLTSSQFQAIVEIDRSLSREVMTSNRDALRAPYDGAFQSFLDDLSVDVRSAMKDQEDRKHVRIEGGLGKLRAKRDVMEIADAMDFVTAPSHAPSGGARPIAPEKYENHTLAGIPDAVMDRFAHRIAAGEHTFLDRIGRSIMTEGAYRALRSGIEGLVRDGGSGRSVLEFLPSVLARQVAEELRHRYECEIKKDEDHARSLGALGDLHDIHMHIEEVNPKVRKAIYRNDPRNWDYASGKGQAPRALLAAWTVCCKQAIATLMQIETKLEPFDFATGWYYGKAEERWLGEDYKTLRTEAQHHKRDDMHILLLNPADEEGRMAINPATPEGRQKIVALALHEVAHICSSRHDEYFAYLQTALLEAFDLREANRSMQEAVKAVRGAYSEGKANIQKMDDEPGVRPAERLLAHAAPIATMMAGLASTDENRDFPADGLRQAYKDCFAPAEYGTVEVDCTALGEVEAAARAGMRRSQTLDMESEAAEPLEDASNEPLPIGEIDEIAAFSWR